MLKLWVSYAYHDTKMTNEQKLLRRGFKMNNRISTYEMLRHMRGLVGSELLEMQQHLRSLKYMSKEPMFKEILDK